MNGKHITIHRLPVVQNTKQGQLRRLAVSVEDGDGRVIRYYPGIENASYSARVPAGSGELVMTKMATKRHRALWLEDTRVFGHPANWARQLQGCWAIGNELYPEGVGYSEPAFENLWHALGGWREGKRVPYTAIEYEATARIDPGPERPSEAATLLQGVRSLAEELGLLTEDGLAWYLRPERKP